MRNIGQDELAAIRAIKEVRGDKANRGIILLWWGPISLSRG